MIEKSERELLADALVEIQKTLQAHQDHLSTINKALEKLLSNQAKLAQQVVTIHRRLNALEARFN